MRIGYLIFYPFSGESKTKILGLSPVIWPIDALEFADRTVSKSSSSGLSSEIGNTIYSRVNKLRLWSSLWRASIVSHPWPKSARDVISPSFFKGRKFTEFRFIWDGLPSFYFIIFFTPFFVSIYINSFSESFASRIIKVRY